MSVFLDDHAENMKDPEYAYEFGRNERELEIIKLLEAECKCSPDSAYCWAAKGIALIKGEK